MWLDRIRRWIRARLVPDDAHMVRQPGTLRDPMERELEKAIPGWNASLAALGPALGALHDPCESDRILREIEREVPAVVEILTAYAMIDIAERTREFVRAWNRGQKALQDLLVTEVGRAMLAGMIIERARTGGGANEAA